MAMVGVALAQEKYPAGIISLLFFVNFAVYIIIGNNYILSTMLTLYFNEKGVSPASCPNYPFCNVNGYFGPPGYHFDRSLGYPAGVHPSTCPNYPYC